MRANDCEPMAAGVSIHLEVGVNKIARDAKIGMTTIKQTMKRVNEQMSHQNRSPVLLKFVVDALAVEIRPVDVIPAAVGGRGRADDSPTFSYRP